MSEPRNPLDNFRTYSYHHILIACDGSQTAEILAKETEITRFDHPRTRFCPRTVRGSDGRYIVLINGMSDAQFTITDAKWATVLAPNDKMEGEDNSHFRTLAVDGELTIKEPMGVNFLNLLNEIQKLLGTDPNGLVFMLKTIFVGIHHDGRTEHLTNIRPLLFVAYDISAVFDVTGAEYMLAFVGVVNGAAQLPHNSAIVSGMNVNIKSTKLGSAMEELATQLGGFYEQHKNSLIASAPEDFDVDENFMDVEYQILLDPFYADFDVGTTEPPNKSNKGTNDINVKRTGRSISIESMIDSLMRSSKQALETDQKPEDRGMFKITSSIISGPTKYVVRYEIQRYKTAIIKAEELYDWSPPDGSGIVFDYIFTGKNIDIKSFDIKMEMGMVFFQTLSVEASGPGSSANILNKFNPQKKTNKCGNVKGTGDQKDTSDICGNEVKKRKQPLFLGSTLDNAELRNKRFGGLSASYDSLLQRHAAIESLEAKVTIRGNPQLLIDSNLLPSDLDPTSNPYTNRKNISDSNVETTGLSADERPLIANPHQYPAYAKINVFMPNEFMEYTDKKEGQDFSRTFWYPGWYYIYSINHIFSDGDFEQELEMISLPTDLNQQSMNASAEKEITAGGSTTTQTPDATFQRVSQFTESGQTRGERE